MESESHSPSTGWQRKGIIRRMERDDKETSCMAPKEENPSDRVGEEQSDPRSENENNLAYLTQLNVRKEPFHKLYRRFHQKFERTPNNF